MGDSNRHKIDSINGLDMAAIFLDTVKVGNGSRITALDSWSYEESTYYEHMEDASLRNKKQKSISKGTCDCDVPVKLRDESRLELDCLERAHVLVEKANKR